MIHQVISTKNFTIFFIETILMKTIYLKIKIYMLHIMNFKCISILSTNIDRQLFKDVSIVKLYRVYKS